MNRLFQWLLLRTPIRRYWCWAAILASSHIVLETLRKAVRVRFEAVGSQSWSGPHVFLLGNAGWDHDRRDSHEGP